MKKISFIIFIFFISMYSHVKGEIIKDIVVKNNNRISKQTIITYGKIELNKDYNLKEISELLSVNGETEINLVIKGQDKQACYSLQNNRKFDLKHLKALKAKEYVEKITV